MLYCKVYTVNNTLLLTMGVFRPLNLILYWIYLKSCKLRKILCNFDSIVYVARTTKVTLIFHIPINYLKCFRRWRIQSPLLSATSKYCTVKCALAHNVCRRAKEYRGIFFLKKLPCLKNINIVLGYPNLSIILLVHWHFGETV